MGGRSHLDCAFVLRGLASAVPNGVIWWLPAMLQRRSGKSLAGAGLQLAVSSVHRGYRLTYFTPLMGATT
jgi:hypothetical protein